MQKRVTNIKNDLGERITFKTKKNESGILVSTNSNKVKIETKLVKDNVAIYESIKKITFSEKPVLGVGDYLILKGQKYKIVDIYLFPLKDQKNSFYLETLIIL